MSVHVIAKDTVHDRINTLVEQLHALQKAYEAERTKARVVDNRKKLAPYEVRRIRELWSTCTWTQKDLAEAFDINPATVSRIVRGIYHA